MQLTYSYRDQRPALSPDGKWVAFYSGAGEDTGFGQIFMIPSQGGLVRQFRHPDLQGAEYPAFSPDGGSLLLVGLSDLRVKKKGRRGPGLRHHVHWPRGSEDRGTAADYQ